MNSNSKKSKRVLLIEPEYKVRYPPLGLMKISTYHKMHGDEVTFYKGERASVRDQNWDIIYIATLFTFTWKSTVETIKFYQRNKTNVKDIRVGGILASLMQGDVEAETGIRPHFGLWEEVDRLPPDYSFADGTYEYYRNNASFAHTTRGCPNHCRFCAVSKLEPEYVDFIPLEPQLSQSKKDLIILDNNALASRDFSQIVNEIKGCGFAKGAMWGDARRNVDFNQGLDSRLLTEEKMELLSQLPIRPLRIAFDFIELEKLYIEKVRLAHKYGLRHLSNYILFNYKDTPEDLYRRLQINIELNAELGLSIFSFPMRYIPLDAKDRRYVSPKWSSTQLRGVQCILHATRGVVGPRKPFFERAFGRTAEEFRYIIEQPEESILYRELMNPYESR